MKLLGAKTLFVVLFSLTGVNGRNIFPGKVLKRASDGLATYDYVVLGGGTSGLVVANRLSENPATTVLIIEAGPFDQNEDWVINPLVSVGNIASLGPGVKGSKYDWNLTGIPQIGLQNRTIPTPLGKVIGGSSVLSEMVFNRGAKADYDRWEKLGNPGWDFDSLFPYLKKSEDFTPPDPELKAEGWDIEWDHANHGETGYVDTSFPPFVWPSVRNYIDAMKGLNVTILRDQPGIAAGASFYTLTVDPKNETRSTSQGFYTPNRPNLHLITGGIVTRIQINSNLKTTGVEYSIGGSSIVQSILVSKEVILAAGALHTPQILELSGIGNLDLLASLGITPQVNLPGVGENYQDHLLAVSLQSINISVSVADFDNSTWLAEQRTLYDTEKKGPFTTVGGNYVAFLPTSTFANASEFISSAAKQSPAQYLHSNTPPTVVSSYSAQFSLLVDEFSSSTSPSTEFLLFDQVILPSLQKTFSRGTVHINTTLPFSSPVIDPRYLSNPLVVQSLVAGFKYARTIRATNAMQSIGAVEIYPGALAETDEEIESYIRGDVTTIHHHSGTAAMLPKELGGVVDSELRVYCVKGLRVVDASILPMLPAAHLLSTVYGVAEKAADLIKNC